MLFLLIDIHACRGWTYAFVVLGSNAIGVYFISILSKVLLMNTPLVDTSRALSLAAVRYGTLIFFSLTAGWAAWRLSRPLLRHIGPASGAIVVLTASIISLLWYRMIAVPVSPATQPTLTSITNAVGNALKQSLGEWEGGWAFTCCFVLFWWLVLDEAYRRRIFWKL